MVAQEIQNIANQFVASVSSRGVNIKKAILYGSVATGKQTTDSDCYIAIISNDFGKDRFNEGKMLMQLAWRIDPRLHPVPIML